VWPIGCTPLFCILMVVGDFVTRRVLILLRVVGRSVG
jgi:hypothetical protein